METQVNPNRKRLVTIAAVALAIALVAGAAFLVSSVFFGPKTITAYFPSATGIYPGDEIRVSGVKVGTIDSITPEGTQAKMTLKVDRDVPVPAEAKAVIVAQNLVAARYVQLAPAYRSGDGPTMGDGGVIPSERTAVPVEWDDVKTQLMRLATELGPKSDSPNAVSDTSVNRFIDSAANALGNGNGEKLRETLAQLSGVARVFAEGSGNIVDIIKNLQLFVSTLRDSKDQIVLFENRLATLTSVLNDNRSDLDAALKNLSVAITEVQRFVAGTRNQTAEQIQRLGNLTQVLVDNRLAFENVLHITPNAIANFNNIYYPNGGSVTGAFSLVNFSNPVQAICGMIGAVENTTAAGDGEAVRAVLRSGVAAAEHQRAADSDQLLSAACDQPGPDDLHRSQLIAGRPRPAGSAGASADGVRLHRSGRYPAAAGMERAAQHMAGRLCARRPRSRLASFHGSDQQRAADRGTARHLEYSGPRVVHRGDAAPADRGTDSAGTARRPECTLAACRRDADAMSHGTKRLAVIGSCVALTMTGCSFQGLNSLPLPGSGGTRARTPRSITSRCRMSRRWSRIRRC